MIRCINANALIARIEDELSDMDIAYEVQDIINDMPTEDVEPVKHGEWEQLCYVGGVLDNTNFDRCTECGFRRIFYSPNDTLPFRYCPHCGAKMRGDEE